MEIWRETVVGRSGDPAHQDLQRFSCRAHDAWAILFIKTQDGEERGVDSRDGIEMRPTMPTVSAICLATSLAYCFQQPSQTGQEKTQRPASQQETPDITPHDDMKFKLLHHVQRCDQEWRWLRGRDFRNTDPHKGLSHHRAFRLARKCKEGIRRQYQGEQKE